MTQPSQDDLHALDALQRAVHAALDRKRRLGESAVVWQDGRPVITAGDMTTAKSASSPTAGPSASDD